MLKNIRNAFLVCAVALTPAPSASAAYKEICFEFGVSGWAGKLIAYEVDRNGNRTGWKTQLTNGILAHQSHCVSAGEKFIAPGKRFEFWGEVSSSSKEVECGAHSDNADAHPGFWLMPDGPERGKFVFRGGGAIWSPNCNQTQSDLQKHSMCEATYDGMEIPGCEPFAPDDAPQDILHWVVRGDHGIGTLGAYVKNGANPNSVAESEEHFGEQTTPLHVAAWLDRAEYARVLIDEAGVDVDPIGGEGKTPLMLAVERGHPVGILEDLLERGADGSIAADNGDTPIAVAARTGRDNVVRVLVAGAAANVLHKIVRDRLGLELLLTYTRGGADPDRVAPDNTGFGQGNAALHIAAWLNRADYARTLIDEAEADVNLRNDDGQTPLSLAVSQGHPVGILEDLLARGADPNIVTNDGDTPVLLALRGDNEDALRALVAGGADLNQKDEDGDFPLLIAAREDDADAIRMLLENGADPDLTGPDGDFPLYLAARDGKTAAVQALIEGGANVNQAHQNGKTALSIAEKKESDNEAVLENLRAAGAEETHPAAAYEVVSERRGARDLRAALRGGADINYADAEGKTALHLAAAAGLREYLAVLTHREFAADMNAQDSAGRTPLLTAVSADGSDVWGIRALLSRRADADLADSAGDFPLYVAVENGRQDIARLLASARADLDQCHSGANKTARMRAEELANEDRGRYWDVYQFLARRGAAETVEGCGLGEADGS